MKIEKRISLLKSSARSRGIEVRLMNYEYETLLTQGCNYCGIGLSNMGGTCLDRVDSRRGYVLQNVVPCCKICNIAKSSMPLHEFFEWVERAYKHQKRIFDRLEEIRAQGGSTDYSYKEEKDLRKQFADKNNKYCIKVELSDEEKRPEKKRKSSF